MKQTDVKQIAHAAGFKNGSKEQYEALGQCIDHLEAKYAYGFEELLESLIRDDAGLYAYVLLEKLSEDGRCSKLELLSAIPTDVEMQYDEVKRYSVKRIVEELLAKC